MTKKMSDEQLIQLARQASFEEDKRKYDRKCALQVKNFIIKYNIRAGNRQWMMKDLYARYLIWAKRYKQKSAVTIRTFIHSFQITLGNGIKWGRSGVHGRWVFLDVDIELFDLQILPSRTLGPRKSKSG